MMLDWELEDVRTLLWSMTQAPSDRVQDHAEDLNEAIEHLDMYSVDRSSEGEAGLKEALQAGLPAVVERYGDQSAEARNVRGLLDRFI